MKIATLDIDGILNNYPFCWLDYIDLHKNKKYSSIEEAKKHLHPEEYKQIKHSYRSSDYKRKLPVNPLASAFTRKLKEKGYTIVIATSRPFHLYPNLEKITYDWLKENDITFDFLEKKTEQLFSKYPAILFHVDDELEHSHLFLEKNINVYIVRRSDINYLGAEQYKSLKLVDSLNDILTFID